MENELNRESQGIKREKTVPKEESLNLEKKHSVCNDGLTAIDLSTTNKIGLSVDSNGGEEVDNDFDELSDSSCVHNKNNTILHKIKSQLEEPSISGDNFLSSYEKRTNLLSEEVDDQKKELIGKIISSSYGGGEMINSEKVKNQQFGNIGKNYGSEPADEGRINSVIKQVEDQQKDQSDSIYQTGDEKPTLVAEQVKNEEHTNHWVESVLESETVHLLDVYKQHLLNSVVNQSSNSEKKPRKRRKHNSEPVFNYECSYCKKPFKCYSELGRHIRVHTGEKPYACKHCQKSFSQTSHLNAHLLLHEGIKRFTCDYCQKSFSQSYHLKEHIRIHTGEKPYSCNYCNKLFSSTTYLNVHLRIHTKEKPFSCDKCDKSFVNCSNLKSHLRTHTGEKPFTCNVCQKTFNRSNNLNLHLRNHLGIKPYSCKGCNKTFNNTSHLSRHYQRVHTGENSSVTDVLLKTEDKPNLVDSEMVCEAV